MVIEGIQSSEIFIYFRYSMVMNTCLRLSPSGVLSVHGRPTNILVALNYLARLTCVAGNLSLMLQQVRPEELFISVINFMSKI